MNQQELDLQPEPSYRLPRGPKPKPRPIIIQPINALYRLIGLTQNQVVIVDVEDFRYLSRFNYFAVWSRTTKSFYAARNISLGHGKQRMVQMHRELLSAPDGIDVDHENHDTLDNRRSNIRLATRAQNQANRRKQAGTAGTLKGANKTDRGWSSEIRKNGVRVYLGTFTSEQAAHEAYKEKAKELHGEFACFG